MYLIHKPKKGTINGKNRISEDRTYLNYKGLEKKMWVINIQHWFDETKTGPAVPQLRLKVKKLSEIIVYATSAAAGILTDSTPRCWRRPERKPCKGLMDIYLDPITAQIYWHCSACKDEGVVSGWEGPIWDMLDTPDNNIH